MSVEFTERQSLALANACDRTDGRPVRPPPEGVGGNTIDVTPTMERLGNEIAGYHSWRKMTPHEILMLPGGWGNT